MTHHVPVKIVGNGPPLVLLHGWGWHAGIWEPLVPELAEHFQLFLIDLPGFGKSPVITSDYTIETIAACLLRQTPPNAIWLGWSLGGMIAWWIALHHPDRVSQLVTIASTPRFVADHLWPGVPDATLTKFSTALLVNYEQTVTDFLHLQLRGSPASDTLFTELHQQLLSVPQPSSAALLGGLDLLRGLDLRAATTALQQPSLHFFGSHDTLVPLKVITMLETLLPQAQCEIIPRTGHIPFLVKKELFLQTLLRWLQTH